jgi:release factor glutamine methyltransferase
MATVAHHINEVIFSLTDVSETAYLDAQVLLGHVLERPRSWIMAHPEFDLGQDQERVLRDFLNRLKTGEPLPYVLGHREFYGLDFIVSPDVLIPRPETELLVEQALGWLCSHPQSRRAVDVGTGSACSAVTLASLVPDLMVLATDISPAALEIARRNALKHDVAERVGFVKADLLDIRDSFDEAEVSTFDLICANLPYIPTQRLETLIIFGKEPSQGLDGGVDGLDLIRRLIAQAPAALAPEGLLMLEIDDTQGEIALSLAQTAFPEARASLLSDLAGRDRLIKVERLS